MRLIILLIPIACGFIATVNLLESDFFNFFMWSFAAVALFLVALPLVFNTKKEAVPIYQIFLILFVLLLVTSAIAYLDIAKLKIPNAQAIVYGGVAGLCITSLLMAIRPK